MITVEMGETSTLPYLVDAFRIGDDGYYAEGEGEARLVVRVAGANEARAQFATVSGVHDEHYTLQDVLFAMALIIENSSLPAEAILAIAGLDEEQINWVHGQFQRELDELDAKEA